MREPENPFDDLAPFYDSWFESPLGGVAGDVEGDLLLRLAQPASGERALEVGVGTGFFARRMAEAGAQVMGVDVSAPMLRMAAAKGVPVSLLRGDAQALPVQGEAFDLVYTVTMLEFVRDPAAAVDSMWAAVRPGGRLVVAVLNRWSPWAWRKAPPFDRAHLYSAPELVRLLRRHGRVRWSSSLFVLPNGAGLRHAAVLERFGRACLRPFGALLVARVGKAAAEDERAGRPR